MYHPYMYRRSAADPRACTDESKVPDDMILPHLHTYLGTYTASEAFLNDKSYFDESGRSLEAQLRVSVSVSLHLRLSLVRGFEDA